MKQLIFGLSLILAYLLGTCTFDCHTAMYKVYTQEEEVLVIVLKGNRVTHAFQLKSQNAVKAVETQNNTVRYEMD